MENEIEFLTRNKHSLPFKCLVLAPLMSEANWQGALAPMSINMHNFSRVMRQFSPTVTVQIESDFLCELLSAEKQTLEISYQFNDLSAFTPAQVIKTDSTLFALAQLVEELNSYLQFNHIDFKKVLAVIHAVPLPLAIPTINIRSDIEKFLLLLKSVLENSVSQMLHNPAWQSLESCWRSVFWLCQQQGSTQCSIDILPMSRTSLWEDLMHSPSLEDSEFYQLLHSNNYGQFGAVPYGAVLIDNYFSITGSDLLLLKKLSEIGKDSHVPIITACSAECFGLTDFTDLSHADGLIDLHQSARFIKWRSFIASDTASYLVMTLPRIRIRPLYDSSSSYQEDYEWFIESFASHADYLWTNAGYAFLINLIKSFDTHGFCSAISGQKRGLLDSSFFNAKSQQLPIEITIPQSREAEIIRLGFNPIVVREQGSALLFNSTNSVRWGHVMGARALQTPDALASAQLNYLLIVLRIAHCLKILFREKVGSHQTTAHLQADINSWLRQFVSAVSSPSEELRLQRPLKEGLVIIHQRDSSSWYDIGLTLQPHLRYLGQHVTVDLSISISEGDD